MLYREKHEAMEVHIQRHIDAIQSGDAELQGQSFQTLVKATAEPVEWAYEVWDQLLRLLKHEDNRCRAITAQILCRLAVSDPKQRMVGDIPALLEVTRDERFVTARHCLQTLWRVGVAGKRQREVLVEGLTGRFHECATEKNCTLIRYDIIECLRKIQDQAGDELTRGRALELIETENDLKYRKKYLSRWKRK